MKRKPGYFPWHKPFIGFSMAVVGGMTITAMYIGLAPRWSEIIVAEGPKLQLVAKTFKDLQGWDEDDLGPALKAFQISCAKGIALTRVLHQIPNGHVDRIGSIDTGMDHPFGSPNRWHQACAKAAAVRPEDGPAARQFFQNYFFPVLVRTEAGHDGLFTGYYEPWLKGSRTETAEYRYPLYRRPDDLVTVDLRRYGLRAKTEEIVGRLVGKSVVPYFDRAAIDRGALEGRSLELVWVNDPIDLFFLHIQGSGRIRLTDGDTMRVGYAGRNGRRYVAIGGVLVRREVLRREDMSLQTIRAWLRRNRDQVYPVLHHNPSYIFFAERPGPGPIGAQGVPLTPNRSLAVDPRFIPFGVPLWLVVGQKGSAPMSIRRLMIAQDGGSAIRGPIRGDLFCGHGPGAEETAGQMKASGRYYALLPRAESPKDAEPVAPAAR